MNKKIMALGALLFLSQASAALVSIEVLDATIKDKKIAEADVLLQRDGAQTAVGRTNTLGQVQLSPAFSADENALLIIKKPGFSNLVVKCPCDGLTYAISPVMKNLDGMRIVLTWGATPADLDSHLVYGNSHIYFDNQKGPDANLDVDDVDSYGPETITIEKKRFGESYLYAVHDYTHIHEPDQAALSNSQAKVFVYVGQSLVRTYSVPRNQDGNLWTVFRLNPNGDFEDINTIKQTGYQDPNNVAAGVSGQLSGRAATGVVNVNQAAAKALNRQGEDAYRRGDLESAIAFYQQAIEQDAVFSQAYSNLGLAYQKLERIAEAIWANRKAIALADGPNAATVRASSYYNIARIYEAAGQLDDALRHYQLAKAQKDNATYDQAISRIKSKL
ncbi:YfaP family protein [Dickeya solani]|uniref:Tetratricopeptide repeat protein n=1 Tax=Dickeya solani TaxID=1089444 RepID=A0ABU4EA72_9GAMM|nr:tetratricopeptide repeat protein [Dickeya solani]MCA6998532.1 tetratricopeptide repeat protein [Dickeya solani]MCZ0821982.1 tetratricopeptide repeat protein [Dickeya solani]MDV6996311.1 tetratricopeptide repeat protein [Dickeya solani]MDV7005959.1 tetratricopeptide repeat protein [Dickeya solani]MDV7039408.1 tetratricopeptide repeat protein [Dickeya solani]